MKYLVFITFIFGIILTYFLIRLALYHETGSKTFTNFLLWQKPDPFWRIISSTEVFPKNQSPVTSISISAFPPAQQSLHSRRRNVSLDLSHCPGIRTDRNISPLKIQWCLPISHGITHLSQSNYFKTIPSSDGPTRSSKIEETSRPITLIHDLKTLSPYQGDLRSGLHRSYPLWKTGDGSYWLQSQKVGETFLSSPSLLQRDHQGFLAWRTAPWRYPYRYWNHRTSESLLCETTSFCKDRSYPSRQGLLRSRDHRIPGIQESPFCHCGQAYRSGQETNLNLILSGPFLWPGDRRVYVSTHEMEKGVPFCSDQASHPRRSYRTTHPLLYGHIQLSSDCDEYETDPSPYLEVLQWPSRCRIDYQRTQRGLSFGENPDKTVCSQRGLLPHSSIFLQPHQLVQTTLLVNGVSKYDA